MHDGIAASLQERGAASVAAALLSWSFGVAFLQQACGIATTTYGIATESCDIVAIDIVACDIVAKCY